MADGKEDAKKKPRGKTVEPCTWSVGVRHSDFSPGAEHVGRSDAAVSGLWPFSRGSPGQARRPTAHDGPTLGLITESLHRIRGRPVLEPRTLNAGLWALDFGP